MAVFLRLLTLVLPLLGVTSCMSTPTPEMSLCKEDRAVMTAFYAGSGFKHLAAGVDDSGRTYCVYGQHQIMNEQTSPAAVCNRIPGIRQCNVIEIKMGTATYSGLASSYGRVIAIDTDRMVAQATAAHTAAVPQQQSSVDPAVAQSLGFMLGCALSGGNCATPSPSPPPIIARQQQPATKPFRPIPLIGAASSGCVSDFDCGPGRQCQKPPMSSTGFCYRGYIAEAPRPSSVQPNFNPYPQCFSDANCPLNSRCDTFVKACVPR